MSYIYIIETYIIETFTVSIIMHTLIVAIPVSAPDPVTDLECPDSGDGAVLLISWTSPGSNDSYTYTIEIQEYYQDNIRLTLLLRPLNPPFNQEVHVAIADEVTINVTSGVGEYHTVNQHNDSFSPL